MVGETTVGMTAECEPCKCKPILFPPDPATCHICIFHTIAGNHNILEPTLYHHNAQTKKATNF